MNRDPVVSLSTSIDFPLCPSRMANHFWVLAPFSLRIEFPFVLADFCRGRKMTLEDKPRPSMTLGFTSIGTGHFLWLNVGECFGGIRQVVALSRSGVDEEACRACERMEKSLQDRVVEP